METILQAGMCAKVGRVIACLGEPRFPAALSDALRETAAFDYCVVFGYSDGKRPLALYDDFPPDRHRVHVTDYLEGPYILDPFFLASQDPGRRGLYRLSDIAPDRFYQGEYFKSYYGQTGLAEEVGYLVTVSENLTLVLSLMRRQKRFSAAEFRHLAALWPVVDAAARQHWGRLKHPRADGQDGIEGAHSRRVPLDRPRCPDAAGTRGRRVHSEGVFGRRDRQGAQHLAGNGSHPPPQHLCQVAHQFAGRTVLRLHHRDHAGSRVNALTKRFSAEPAGRADVAIQLRRNGSARRGGPRAHSCKDRFMNTDETTQLTSTGRWIAMATLLVAGFMNLIDVTIVNVALPSLRSDFGASANQIEWVVAAYILVFALVLIPGGRYGDLLGRRRMFLWGVCVFTLGSALCGMAPSIAALVAARILQAVGAALMTPQTMAIVPAIFPREERGAAFAAFGFTAGLASVTGPVLGGLLIRWTSSVWTGDRSSW